MKHNWLIAQVLLIILIMLSCIAATKYLTCTKCSDGGGENSSQPTFSINDSYAINFSKRLTNVEQDLIEIKSLINQVDKQNKVISPGTNQISLSTKIKNLQLAISILQLGLAIRTYKPFDQELNIVRQLSIETPQLRLPLDNLAHYATTGVATIAELRDSFGIILLPKLYTLADREDVSWTGQVWTWVWATLVPWTTASSHIPINLTRALAKSAMERLSEDDLKGALDIITKLNSLGATLTARWLKEANNRLAVDAAIDAVSNVGMELLSRN